MNNLVDKIYVHAKISALHGYLLSKDDYLEIARSGKIHSAFPEILTEKDASDVIQAKDIIFRNHIKPFILFIGLNDYYHEFFKAFLSLFELSNIKYILLKAYGRTRLVPQWNDVTPYDTVDKSLRDKDIQLNELRALFAHTIFSEALSFDEPPAYEDLERKIDFLTLKNMLRFSVRLNSDDEMILHDILIRKMVSLKIIWDGRCAQHYENDFQQFNPLDIFDGSTATRKKIESIENEIRKRIRADSDVAEAYRRSEDIPLVEIFLDSLFLSHVKKIFSKNFHSIGPVVSYAWSLYYQIRNLFAIIEGFDLKSNPDIILRHIITGA